MREVQNQVRVRGENLPTDFEKYLAQLKLDKLFEELGASDPETLAKMVKHFTTKEAEKRDKIVLGYFGQHGINRIVKTITQFLLGHPNLPRNAKILDVGAGTGFLTVKIARKIRAELPDATFYALDLTPAMLLMLAKKNVKIKPFVGMAENIQTSIKQARKYFNIPTKFDAVFSTLMLHHSTSPENVFKSLKTILKKNGKAVIADMCEHSFKEFKTEMGDVHLGFELRSIREMAQRYFKRVRVEKIPGICCQSSGRSAEIFVAYLHN
jgi:ArsR family transcriptional regulator